MVYDNEELLRGVPCESEREKKRKRERGEKRKRERERSDGARRVHVRTYASVRVRE